MATIISYPNNEINETVTIPDTFNSAEIVQYINIDVSQALTDEFIAIDFFWQLVTLLITEECRYIPQDINFINKNGAQQVLTFFKAKTETLSITSETYEGNLQLADFNHHFIRYNSQAK